MDVWLCWGELIRSMSCRSISAMITSIMTFSSKNFDSVTVISLDLRIKTHLEVCHNMILLVLFFFFSSRPGFTLFFLHVLQMCSHIQKLWLQKMFLWAEMNYLNWLHFLLKRSKEVQLTANLSTCGANELYSIIWDIPSSRVQSLFILCLPLLMLADAVFFMENFILMWTIHWTLKSWIHLENFSFQDGLIYFMGAKMMVMGEHLWVMVMMNLWSRMPALWIHQPLETGAFAHGFEQSLLQSMFFD